MGLILPDPGNFTRFDRTQVELEAMLMFSIFVAGKRADLTVVKLGQFLGLRPWIISPFETVMDLDKHGRLRWALEFTGIGQYRRVEPALRGVVKLDPRTCSLEELESIHGVGPKTARMFLMHSRPEQDYAALDTHVLHFMRDVGIPNVPRTTPGKGRDYLRLEQEFLMLAHDLDVTPENLDLTVWKHYTRSRL